MKRKYGEMYVVDVIGYCSKKGQIVRNKNIMPKNFELKVAEENQHYAKTYLHYFAFFISNGVISNWPSNGKLPSNFQGLSFFY